MNIEKLLKKLDRNTIDNKKQLLSVQGPYKLKTSQSIGTLNSLPDQNQRSFVITDAVTPQSKKLGFELLSANSKLDDELLNIQKMKNLYESRQNKNRVRTKSIQRNSASGQKSKEKHLLKPSNTPSFNKLQKNRVQPQNDSACKNLYNEQILGNSQISQTSAVSQTKTSHVKVSQKNCYQYLNSSIQAQDAEQQPYQEEPSYNEESLSQIANISQDLPQELISKMTKKNEINCQQAWQCSSNPSEVKKKIQFPPPQICDCKCMKREEIMGMLAGFQQKMQEFTLKLQQLEEQNRKMKTIQTQLQTQNSKIQLELIECTEQKEKALQEVRKQQQQKQELETLLKDVLYKRERQKLQSSKENTHRQNDRNDKKANNFSFAHSQSTAELKQRNNNSLNSLIGAKPRESDSKMKVQNLLHKLQIRVDRS